MSLLCFQACSDSTAPPIDRTPPLVFDPAEVHLPLTHNQIVDFKVIDRTNPNYDVTWPRNLQVMGVGPRYQYVPQRYGPDTLTAWIEYEDLSTRRRWLLDIAFPDPVVEFLPENPTLQVIETMSMTLLASSNRSHVAQYQWTLNGEEAGTDSSYVFEGREPGYHEVHCETTIDEESFNHTWNIQTLLLSEVDMPIIQAIQVTRGDLFGEIHFSWHGIDVWYVDIEEYRLLVSFDGPITEENIDQATELFSVPHIQYQQTYLETIRADLDERLVSEATAWFTIVGVDERGTQSPPATVSPMLIPFYWYIEGTVLDLAGEPLAGVEVLDSATEHLVVTGVDGAYRIGPFPDTRVVALAATLSAGDEELGWHDVISREMTMNEPRHRDFIMVPRWGSAPGCTYFDEHFMKYFRYMTATLTPWTNRPDVVMRRWESYPLRIHIPPHTNSTGVDFGAAAATAVQIWNDLLGEETLIPVADSAQAEIHFEYPYGASTHFGFTLLNEPGGGSYDLGTVIPEDVSVLLYDSISTLRGAELTALHELGHALGIIAHAPCSNVGYLMYSAPSVPSEDWPAHAIHPDELRMVRTIRHLPQSTDMSEYLID